MCKVEILCSDKWNIKEIANLFINLEIFTVHFTLHLYLDLGYFGLENWTCNLAASVSDIKTLIKD